MQPAVAEIDSNSMPAYPIDLEDSSYSSTQEPDPIKDRSEGIHFLHAYEKAVFNTLSSYGFTVLYEPREFPLKWHYKKVGGEKKMVVHEAFTPDLYVEELDLYIELTAMQQKLITKKNGKIRKTREIYPDVNIVLWTRKDLEDFFFSKNPQALRELEEFIDGNKPAPETVH